MRAGVWEGRVDAPGARARLLRYLEVGSLRSAARDCGVGLTTLKEVAAGRDRILTDTRDRILALPIPDLPVPPQGYVRAVGTRRRVQGLQVDAWPQYAIAERSGVALATLRDLTGRVEAVSVVVAGKVAACAAELDGQRGPSEISARRAAASGWHSLDAWADIDDPHAEPVDGTCDVDWVLVRQMLDDTRPPAWPDCFPERCSRSHKPCEPCRLWSVNRDEAILIALLPLPRGRGLTVGATCDLLRSGRSTVLRVARDRHGLDVR